MEHEDEEYPNKMNNNMSPEENGQSPGPSKFLM
jgi:hypothetical protein